MMQQLGYNEYEYSNKSGKFLASQLRHNREKSFITTINDLSGQGKRSPRGMRFFKNFITNYIPL